MNNIKQFITALVIGILQVSQTFADIRGESTRILIAPLEKKVYFNDLSADGRFFVYSQGSINPNSPVTTHIYVLNVGTGQTRLVSMASDGTRGNVSSARGIISTDGRFVAFTSPADNLVPNDTNDEPDVFVHDLKTRQTTRVSVNSEGQQVQGCGDTGHDGVYTCGSYAIGLSADGRYVAFYSYATGLVGNSVKGLSKQKISYSNISTYVHDRLTGQTTKIKTTQTGVLGRAITPDARYLLFDTTQSYSEISFIYDRVTRTTEMISVNDQGMPASCGEKDDCRMGRSRTLSDDGRFVSFESYDTRLDSEGACNSRLYLRDRLLGKTHCLGDKSLLPYDYAYDLVGASADGHSVFFRVKTDALPTDHNKSEDIYVYNWMTRTTRVFSRGFQYSPSKTIDLAGISANGRRAVFITADNDGSGKHAEVFLRDTLLQPERKADIQLSIGARLSGKTYPLTISNRGPDDAQHVTLTVRLEPTVANLTFTVDPSQGVCSPGPISVCHLQTLRAGQSLGIPVKLTQKPVGLKAFSLHAEAEASPVDNKPKNNSVHVLLAP